MVLPITVLDGSDAHRTFIFFKKTLLEIKKKNNESKKKNNESKRKILKIIKNQNFQI